MTTFENGLGDRIRQVRQAHRLTQKAFAESLGIGQGFLSSVERGHKIPSDTLLIALSLLYRLNRDWLATGTGDRAGGDPAFGSDPAPETILMPLFSRVAPDFPREPSPEDILGHIALPGSPAECHALQAYGDFMAPTIQDRDLVIFRPGGDFENGDIVLVTDKWGQVILRRYRLTDEGAWLSPDNSTYTPFQPGERTRFVGKVVDVWRRVRF